MHSKINVHASFDYVALDDDTTRARNLYAVIVGSDAHEIAALFPKSVRWHLATRASGTPAAHVLISLRSTGVTGERNETGQRRVRAILRTLDKHALQYEWDHEAYANAYKTREHFEREL